MGGACDFANDIATHFPLQVILSILGLPESDYAKMLKLTQELFGAEDPDIGRAGEDAQVLERHDRLRRLLHRAGRRSPGPPDGRPGHR